MDPLQEPPRIKRPSFNDRQPVDWSPWAAADAQAKPEPVQGREPMEFAPPAATAWQANEPMQPPEPHSYRESDPSPMPAATPWPASGRSGMSGGDPMAMAAPPWADSALGDMADRIGQSLTDAINGLSQPKQPVETGVRVHRPFGGMR